MPKVEPSKEATFKVHWDHFQVPMLAIPVPTSVHLDEPAIPGPLYHAPKGAQLYAHFEVLPGTWQVQWIIYLFFFLLCSLSFISC
jgi:hypothetical protein